MKRKTKLANFDDPKWTYKDLCRFAKHYRALLDKYNASDIGLDYLYAYNSQPRQQLIKNLKYVQIIIYK